jgi:cytochrome c peroxidase
VTGKDSDRDLFKTPSLRNVEKTWPYFHDGSVKDLASAVKIMGKLQLNQDLSDAEVKVITAFLKSMTGELPAAAKEVPEAVKKVTASL